MRGRRFRALKYVVFLLIRLEISRRANGRVKVSFCQHEDSERGT